MALYAQKFDICKGKMGSFQASIIAPTWVYDDKGNCKCTKAGAILIEMAPFLKEENDNFYYDWQRKVSFAIGVPDISLISAQAGTKFSLVHTTDTATKVMQFTPGEGKYEGTMMITLTSKKGDQDLGSAKIACSTGEWLTFCTLLNQSLSCLLGWNEVTGLND